MDTDRLFYPSMPQIHPRPRPMKVLVLGLPRTGTFSMYSALMKLGFSPYHFIETIKNTKNRHFQLWLQALQNKCFGGGEPVTGQDAFDRILWNYDAILDSPGCFFPEELIAAYPEAKVILTTRSRESWLRAMQVTLLEVITWRSWTVLAWFDREFSAPYWALFNRIMRVFSSPPSASHQSPGSARSHIDMHSDSDSRLLQYFDDHYAVVRQLVPEERLLEYHPSQGWEPLCRFLDVPVPEDGEGFPRGNEPATFVQIHKKIYWQRWCVVLKKVMSLKTVGSVGAVGLAVMGTCWWRS